MRYPYRSIRVLVFSAIFSAMSLMIAFPASSQIVEASLGVHLQVVNRCAMLLEASAGDISVHCNRHVAYRISVRPDAANKDGPKRMVVSY